jgi:arylsulfatase A-like enzyme
VPYIVQWPAVASEGQQSDAIVSGLDFLSTFLAAAGGKLPTDREYDGVDLRPYFQGKVAEPTHRTLYHLSWTLSAACCGHFVTYFLHATHFAD